MVLKIYLPIYMSMHTAYLIIVLVSGRAYFGRPSIIVVLYCYLLYQDD